VGYVSPDFRGHSVSYFLTPILEHHDHGQVEVFGYAHVMAPDMHTWRLRAKIDQWRETAGKNAEELADLIREDRIDILVDLAGHTGNNALTVFVRKPAPVQINMIGFPSTTGLTSIDYRITDARCDPPGVSDPFNTETLWRMPGHLLVLLAAGAHPGNWRAPGRRQWRRGHLLVRQQLHQGHAARAASLGPDPSPRAQQPAYLPDDGDEQRAHQAKGDGAVCIRGR
jgi:predicted O-linked N-acetylglucosamine transferase (SPINDLY family)